MINHPSIPFPETLSFRQAINFVFHWWFFIFVLLWIPLDFIYRFNTLLEGLTFLQLIAALSSLALFLIVASLAISLASSLVILILGLFSRQAVNIVIMSNAFLGVWFIFILIFDYYWKWFINVFGFNWTLIVDFRMAMIFIFLALGIAIILACYHKDKFFEKIKLFIAIILKFNLVIVALCCIATLTLLCSNLYIRYAGESRKAVARVPAFRPNIILVTFDALAAQNTSLHGHVRDTTPNLLALARESTVFDHAYAAGNFTPPGASSLLTGKYPHNHGILNDYSLSIGRSQSENLAFILRRIGYQTLAVVANQFASPSQHNMAGFDKVSSNFSQSRFLALVSKYYYISGLGTASWLLPFFRTSILGAANKGLFNLKQKWPPKAPSSEGNERSLGIFAPEFTFGEATEFLQAAREPFFLWVHIWPPHDPYVPSRKFLYRFLKERIYDGPQVSLADINLENFYRPQDQPKIDKLALRYEENILYADDEFGKFLAGLRQKGLLDRSIFIVSSDHGEMFEKGYCAHAGPYLYQPLIHIPLLLRMPNQTRGERLSVNVSQVDLAPTLLDYLGMAIPPWMDGQSFTKVLISQPYQPKPKFSMNLSYKNDPPNFLTKTAAIIMDNYKLIYYLRFHRYELYNLQKDPHELHNIRQKEPDIFLSLKKELDTIFPH